MPTSAITPVVSLRKPGVSMRFKRRSADFPNGRCATARRVAVMFP
ncbi:hypothetical protein BURMUCGD2M_5660 [Burkholderia multivorans CGD2M]|nr:hypothetical protein BURMUCGD2M_5660 [Burkholderia multivorans CGD2M]